MWKKSAIRQIIKYTPKEKVPVIGKINERDENVLKIENNEIKAIETPEENFQVENENAEFGGALSE